MVVLPRHKESNKKSNMTEYVHNIKRHELIYGINLTRFHWITILVIGEYHQAGIEINQKHRNQAKDGNGEGNFRFG